MTTVCDTDIQSLIQEALSSQGVSNWQRTESARKRLKPKAHLPSKIRQLTKSSFRSSKSTDWSETTTLKKSGFSVSDRFTVCTDSKPIFETESSQEQINLQSKTLKEPSILIQSQLVKVAKVKSKPFELYRQSNPDIASLENEELQKVSQIKTINEGLKSKLKPKALTLKRKMISERKTQDGYLTKLGSRMTSKGELVPVSQTTSFLKKPSFGSNNSSNGKSSVQEIPQKRAAKTLVRLKNKSDISNESSGSRIYINNDLKSSDCEVANRSFSDFSPCKVKLNLSKTTYLKLPNKLSLKTKGLLSNKAQNSHQNSDIILDCSIDNFSISLSQDKPFEQEFGRAFD